MPRSGSCLPVLAVASAWLLNQHAGDQVLGHAGQPGNKVDHRVRQPRILVKAARGSRLGGRTARAWWASDVTAVTSSRASLSVSCGNTRLMAAPAVSTAPSAAVV